MASLSKEPLTTFSAVLFARQASEINEEIERTGANRSVILRRLVDRGLDAERAERGAADRDGTEPESEAA